MQMSTAAITGASLNSSQRGEEAQQQAEILSVLVTQVERERDTRSHSFPDREKREVEKGRSRYREVFFRIKLLLCDQ